MTLIQCY